MADLDTVFSGVQTASNVIGSGFNIGFNFANHALAKRQLQLQRESFEWQKNYDQNQTQIRVDDMARAGLNPILASSSGVGSSVGSVSASPATPTQIHGGDFQSLIDLMLEKKQLKQQKDIADNNNKTAKDVAETQAASDKYVADKNNETARINANLNAQTQTAIAAANNEAQAELRSSQSRHYDSMSSQQEWETWYNKQNYLHNGDPRTPAELASNAANKLVEAGRLLPSVVDDFKSWLSDKISAAREKIRSAQNRGK